MDVLRHLYHFLHLRSPERLRLPKIIQKLIHGIHTTQDDFHLRKTRCKTHCERGCTCRRIHLMKNPGRLRRNIGERAAFHRLHHDHLFAVPDCRFITQPGLNRFAVPIQVIDLKLYDIHFRMAGQDLIQQIRRVMKRKTDNPRLPVPFQFLQKLKFPVFFRDLIIRSIQPMQKIHIKIIDTAALQLKLKTAAAVIIGLHHISRQLIRQKKLLPGMTFHN